MRIAIDFDGTCVENEYPGIGEEMPYCSQVLRDLQKKHTLFLHTSRRGDRLDEAKQWFKDRKIDIIHTFAKPGADVYIDDKAINGIPKKMQKVDWLMIQAIVEHNSFVNSEYSRFH